MNNNDYSIIIPVYHNEESLFDLYNEIIKCGINRVKNLEGKIIFVDDGSKDRSYEKLKEIKNIDPERSDVIKLTRNFGQASAVFAGLENSNAKCNIIMSADLQDNPKMIPIFLNHHFNDGYQIVAGDRTKRDESFLREFMGRFFWKLIKKISFSNMPNGGFDFVLISSEVTKAIIDLNESNPFWQGQMLWTGYSTKFVPYTREKRKKGKSTWTLSKKITYLIDGVMGFSFFPIRIASFFGIIISLFGFAFSIYILIAKIYGIGDIVYGWAALMIAILMLGGFQMIILGIIGEYVWRTLSQARNRPNYIIEKKL